MTNPNEPTLTCSEVVERLAKLFHIEYEALGTRVREHLPFDRTQATNILEQWREHRVQELEEALREIVNERASPDEYSVSLFRATKLAERVLKSEWRERRAGSAETGGEKAAPKIRFISTAEVDDCKTFRDYMNLYGFNGCKDSNEVLLVSTLAEHWYETVLPSRAEPREPEKLNNAQNEEAEKFLAEYYGSSEGMFAEGEVIAAMVAFANSRLAESSLSSPPPRNCTKCGLPSWYDIHNMQRINMTNAHHFVAASPELLPTQPSKGRKE